MNITKIPDSPVHFLSALIVVALDFLWSFLEGAVSLTIIGIIIVPILSLIIGSITFVAVSLIQYYIAHDSVGQSLAKGLAMGVLAGVPYMIMGTIVGVPLLAWAGINQISANTTQS